MQDPGVVVQDLQVGAERFHEFRDGFGAVRVDGARQHPVAGPVDSNCMPLQALSISGCQHHAKSLASKSDAPWRGQCPDRHPH
jgi:hypothetical protein